MPGTTRFSRVSIHGKSTNVSLKIALARSSIDQPIFPSSGSNFLLAGSLHHLVFYQRVSMKQIYYKLVEFHKWRFNGEWFVPLVNHTEQIKTASLYCGLPPNMVSWAGITKTCLSRRLKGSRWVMQVLTNNFGVLGYDIIAHRGYPVYETSDPTINPDQQQAQQFFTIFNKYTMEMRYPFVTNPSSTIFGLAFLKPQMAGIALKIIIHSG